MAGLIEESLTIAAGKFQNFGFNEAQIEKLLLTGKRDLEQEVEKLKILLSEPVPDIAKINNALHALKGLLYNLGNMDAGDIMAELENDLDSATRIEEIKKVLNLA